MASIHGIDIRDNVLFYHKKVIVPGVIDVTSQFRNTRWQSDISRLKKVSKDHTRFYHPLMVDAYDNNQYSSYFQPDSLTRAPLGAEGVSYWSIQKTGWFASRLEPGYPKGATAEQIVEVFDMHRTNMWKRHYEFNEKARWINPTYPNDGSTGQIQVNGIPHFVVIDSPTSTVAQSAGHPTGYSTVNGLSRTTYPELKNWQATATDMSISNGQKRLDDMIDLMQWVCPKDLPGEEKPKLNYVIESHRTPYTLYRDQKYSFIGDADYSKDPAKIRNSDTSVGNGLLFRGIPWLWADALTQSTTRDGTANPAYNSSQPVYLLDQSTWCIYAAEGLFQDESEPVMKSDDHNTYAMHMDTVYQRVCYNPGANGVITFA
jgi:hypothetical protein